MRDLLIGPAEIRALSAALRKAQFFSDLNSPDLERVFDLTKLRGYEAGDKIFRKGQLGDALYVVYKGAVDIVVPRFLRPAKKLARLVPGDMFGEMALLGQESRTATALANGPTELFVLFRPDFNDVVRTNPKFARTLAGMAERRAFETESGS